MDILLKIGACMDVMHPSQEGLEPHASIVKLDGFTANVQCTHIKYNPI